MSPYFQISNRANKRKADILQHKGHYPIGLLDWFPAVTTSGLLAMALWLGRNLILTRLTKSVEYEFSKKIEAVRTQFREGEERLKADLRAKEVEIAALRSGAMTALASRQIAVDKRRLE